MVDQGVSQLVVKLDQVMAEAGYARVAKTTPELGRGAGARVQRLHDMIATVYPSAHLSVPRSVGTLSAQPMRAYTYRDSGVSQRPTAPPMTDPATTSGACA
ncbi:hypothetical protein BH24CHL6_BH24CHL6_10090 [soil metagenome]